MIDLNRFSEPIEAIMPVVNGWGVFGSRKIWNPILEDSWYLTNLADRALVTRPATPLEVEKVMQKQKAIRGYVLGNEIIPVNFDNFQRKGLGEAVTVQFLALSVFEVAKVIQWEDNRFYFYEADPKFDRSIINQVKSAFDKEEPITNIKGLTPELRYYYMLLNLQRQSYREFQELEKLKLSEAEREKRIKEFQNSFSGRLQETVEDVGGKLIKFVKYRTGWTVTWKLGNQTVKSNIRDDMRIMSLGFCASGADRKHTLSSAILLAKMFQRDNPLNITRE